MAGKRWFLVLIASSNARLFTRLAGVNFWQFSVLNRRRNRRHCDSAELCQHRIPDIAFLKGETVARILRKFGFVSWLGLPRLR